MSESNVFQDSGPAAAGPRGACPDYININCQRSPRRGESPQHVVFWMVSSGNMMYRLPKKQRVRFTPSKAGGIRIRRSFSF